MSLLSTDNIIKELQYIHSTCLDNANFLESADELLDLYSLNEAEYNKVTSRLKLEILDVDLFVERNNCKCVSDPRAFTGSNIPSPNGLLSNEIFGYTQRERTGTFAYINLHGHFMDPSCYKTWIRLDRRIKDIVHGVKSFRLDDRGELVEDENGETGINFLYKNINKIKFKDSQSLKKSMSISYLENNRNNIFIDKYIVIPPFYRDKNTSSNSRKTVGLGGINKMYNNLIVATNALTATQDYGIDASDAMNGRVQELILVIYDWFCGNANSSIPKDESGTGLSGKMGILRRANMSKTSDFSSRLVISPIDLKSADKPVDLMVSLDRSAVPLYACIAQFRDFVMFHVRLFFQNEFTGSQSYPVIDKNGKVKYIIPEAPEITFSDERIKEEMERFLHGYNNRLIPIEVPVEGTNEKYYMMFNPQNVDETSSQILSRRLTWCDVFYMATVEAVKDKQILICRFPVDYFTNQFTTGVIVSSTNETENVKVNGVEYPYYPKIREKDILSDTSNMFVDTLRFSNLYLASIGGDQLLIIHISIVVAFYSNIKMKTY